MVKTLLNLCKAVRKSRVAESQHSVKSHHGVNFFTRLPNVSAQMGTVLMSFQTEIRKYVMDRFFKKKQKNVLSVKNKMVKAL